MHGAKPGPAPAHDVEIWLGAYKPRMLRLTGAKADGWLPSMSYLDMDGVGELNARIDARRRRRRPLAGGDPPAAQRRSRAWSPSGSPSSRCEHGFGTFILSVSSDDGPARASPTRSRRAVRELVDAGRGGARLPAEARGARRPAVRGHPDPGRPARERRDRLGRDHPPERPGARPRAPLHARPAGGRPAPDRRPRRPARGARPAARPGRAGRRRPSRPGRRALVHQPHDDPPERLDPRRLLRLLLPGRGRPPHARGPLRLPAPARPRRRSSRRSSTASRRSTR